MTSQNAQSFSRSGFWIFKISRKVRVWNSPNLHCSAVFPTWQYCLYSHVWWKNEINRFWRLSQALVHFVMARASLFTDHKISGLPIRAKYKHFRTIGEHAFDNSPTDFVSSSVKWWSSMHGVDTLSRLLSRLVCQLTISFHTLLCMTHRVTRPWRNTSILGEWKFFCSRHRNSRFKHGSVVVHNIFAYFALSLSAPQVYMIKEKCWFSQIDFFYCTLSTLDQSFVSFQPVWCRPHTQIRTTLFQQRDIPNLELSPNHDSMGLSQIAFPTIVLPKDDRTVSFQEERLGGPYWTMIWAICVVVDESKCLDTPILEFSTICEHLPFPLGCLPILRLLLVHRNQAIWRWYPWSWLQSFEMLKILVQWMLHKNQNCLLQYHLGVQLGICISDVLPPKQHFSDDRCPLMMQNELWRPTSLLHRSHFSYFWLSSGSTRNFLQSLSTAAFSVGIFTNLRHRNKLVNQIAML